MRQKTAFDPGKKKKKELKHTETNLRATLKIISDNAILWIKIFILINFEKESI